MRYDIIKTEKYLLVCDDSEIKMGDWFINLISEELLICFKNSAVKSLGGKTINNTEKWLDNNDCKKIIAHLPLNGAPYLDDVSVLPSLLKEDDVQKLADEASQKFKRNDELDDLILGVSANSFEEGYNKAREKYKFTEEDLRKAMKMAQEQELVRHTDSEYRAVIAYTHSEMDIIKSLQQPKYPIAFECDIEPEYTHIGSTKEVKGSGDRIKNKNAGKPKTIIASEGRVELVGKYIYE